MGDDTGQKQAFVMNWSITVKWAFTQNGDPYPVDHDFNIEITDHTKKKQIKIKQKPGVEPHRTLGAYVESCGAYRRLAAGTNEHKIEW